MSRTRELEREMELGFWGGPQWTQIIAFGTLGVGSLIGALTVRQKARSRDQGSFLAVVLFVLSFVFLFISISGFDTPVW